MLKNLRCSIFNIFHDLKEVHEIKGRYNFAPTFGLTQFEIVLLREFILQLTEMDRDVKAHMPKSYSKICLPCI